ncbi:hypothetical protein [Desulfovibrio gilichinskyi]|uniref:hypothetical protein n=1 Tax=Desulfovibrio gilichinskyi TaxID=1519643 RepID=UPI000A1654C4|nr:hypothetical protein [Desulfovibrio gilichinskyi]
MFQRFNRGDSADFEENVAVVEHFEEADCGFNESGEGKIKSEREDLLDTLKNLGAAFSPKDSMPKLRKILKEAESE